jgi:hypothetical protein
MNHTIGLRALLIIGASLGGCASQVPLDNSPCPCPASLGYMCCGTGNAARCIRPAEGQTCSGSGPTIDASADVGPDDDARPLLDAQPAEVGTPDARTGSPINMIAVGAAHACAIRDDYTLSCIGDNSKGQATPPEGQFWGIVTGPDSDFTCASKIDKSDFNKDGQSVCWGDDTYGQIPLPTGIKNVVAAGARHACGTTAADSNTLVCWGDNSYGQATPPAGPLYYVTAGRNHTCAVRPDGGSVETGTIVCWGDNSKGQLNAPKVHLWSLMWLSAAGDHTCVTDWNYAVWCWGDNSRGQSTPPVGFLGGLSVAAGHACATTMPYYQLVCWGDDWGTANAGPPSGDFNNVFVGDNFNCAQFNPGSGEPPICWGSTYQPWY